MRQFLLGMIFWAMVHGSSYPMKLHGTVVCAKYEDDYKSFHNMAALLKEIYSSGKSWRLVAFAECHMPQTKCPTKYLPVCGYSNGITHTFTNLCVMNSVPGINGQDWQLLFSSPCKKNGYKMKSLIRLRSKRDAPRSSAQESKAKSSQPTKATAVETRNTDSKLSEHKNTETRLTKDSSSFPESHASKNKSGERNDSRESHDSDESNESGENNDSISNIQKTSTQNKTKKSSTESKNSSEELDSSESNFGESRSKKAKPNLASNMSGSSGSVNPTNQSRAKGNTQDPNPVGNTFPQETPKSIPPPKQETANIANEHSHAASSEPKTKGNFIPSSSSDGSPLEVDDTTRRSRTRTPADNDDNESSSLEPNVVTINSGGTTPSAQDTSSPNLDSGKETSSSINSSTFPESDFIPANSKFAALETTSGEPATTIENPTQFSAESKSASDGLSPTESNTPDNTSNFGSGNDTSTSNDLTSMTESSSTPVDSEFIANESKTTQPISGPANDIKSSTSTQPSSLDNDPLETSSAGTSLPDQGFEASSLKPEPDSVNSSSFAKSAPRPLRSKFSAIKLTSTESSSTLVDTIQTSSESQITSDQPSSTESISKDSNSSKSSLTEDIETRSSSDVANSSDSGTTPLAQESNIITESVAPPNSDPEFISDETSLTQSSPTEVEELEKNQSTGSTTEGTQQESNSVAPNLSQTKAMESSSNEGNTSIDKNGESDFTTLASAQDSDENSTVSPSITSPETGVDTPMSTELIPREFDTEESMLLDPSLPGEGANSAVSASEASNFPGVSEPISNESKALDDSFTTTDENITSTPLATDSNSTEANSFENNSLAGNIDDSDSTIPETEIEDTTLTSLEENSNKTQNTQTSPVSSDETDENSTIPTSGPTLAESMPDEPVIAELSLKSNDNSFTETNQLDSSSATFGPEPTSEATISNASVLSEESGSGTTSTLSTSDSESWTDEPSFTEVNAMQTSPSDSNSNTATSTEEFKNNAITSEINFSNTTEPSTIESVTSKETPEASNTTGTTPTDATPTVTNSAPTTTPVVGTNKTSIRRLSQVRSFSSTSVTTTTEKPTTLKSTADSSTDISNISETAETGSSPAGTTLVPEVTTEATSTTEEVTITSNGTFTETNTMSSSNSSDEADVITEAFTEVSSADESHSDLSAEPIVENSSSTEEFTITTEAISLESSMLEDYDSISNTSEVDLTETSPPDTLLTSGSEVIITETPSSQFESVPDGTNEAEETFTEINTMEEGPSDVSPETAAEKTETISRSTLTESDTTISGNSTSEPALGESVTSVSTLGSERDAILAGSVPESVSDVVSETHDISTEINNLEENAPQTSTKDTPNSSSSKEAQNGSSSVEPISTSEPLHETSDSPATDVITKDSCDSTNSELDDPVGFHSEQVGDETSVIEKSFSEAGTSAPNPESTTNETQNGSSSAEPISNSEGLDEISDSPTTDEGTQNSSSSVHPTSISERLEEVSDSPNTDEISKDSNDTTNSELDDTVGFHSKQVADEPSVFEESFSEVGTSVENPTTQETQNGSSSVEPISTSEGFDKTSDSPTTDEISKDTDDATNSELDNTVGFQSEQVGDETRFKEESFSEAGTSAQNSESATEETQNGSSSAEPTSTLQGLDEISDSPTTNQETQNGSTSVEPISTSEGLNETSDSPNTDVISQDSDSTGNTELDDTVGFRSEQVGDETSVITESFSEVGTSAQNPESTTEETQNDSSLAEPSAISEALDEISDTPATDVISKDSDGIANSELDDTVGFHSEQVGDETRLTEESFSEVGTSAQNPESTTEEILNGSSSAEPTAISEGLDEISDTPAPTGVISKDSDATAKSELDDTVVFHSEQVGDETRFTEESSPEVGTSAQNPESTTEETQNGSSSAEPTSISEGLDEISDSPATDIISQDSDSTGNTELDDTVGFPSEQVGDETSVIEESFSEVGTLAQNPESTTEEIQNDSSTAEPTVISEGLDEISDTPATDVISKDSDGTANSEVDDTVGFHSEQVGDETRLTEESFSEVGTSAQNPTTEETQNGSFSVSTREGLDEISDSPTTDLISQDSDSTGNTELDDSVGFPSEQVGDETSVIEKSFSEAGTSALNPESTTNETQNGSSSAEPNSEGLDEISDSPTADEISKDTDLIADSELDDSTEPEIVTPSDGSFTMEDGGESPVTAVDNTFSDEISTQTPPTSSLQSVPALDETNLHEESLATDNIMEQNSSDPSPVQSTAETQNISDSSLTESNPTESNFFDSDISEGTTKPSNSVTTESVSTEINSQSTDVTTLSTSSSGTSTNKILVKKSFAFKSISVNKLETSTASSASDTTVASTNTTGFTFSESSQSVILHESVSTSASETTADSESTPVAVAVSESTPAAGESSVNVENAFSDSSSSTESSLIVTSQKSEPTHVNEAISVSESTPATETSTYSESTSSPGVSTETIENAFSETPTASDSSTIEQESVGADQISEIVERNSTVTEALTSKSLAIDSKQQNSTEPLPNSMRISENIFSSPGTNYFDNPLKATEYGNDLEINDATYDTAMEKPIPDRCCTSDCKKSIKNTKISARWNNIHFGPYIEGDYHHRPVHNYYGFLPPHKAGNSSSNSELTGTVKEHIMHALEQLLAYVNEV